MSKQIVLEINNVVDMIRLAWVDLWLINLVETGFNVLYCVEEMSHSFVVSFLVKCVKA